MNTQTSVSREDALEILFANRNRAYGAYKLRRQYNHTLARAFGIGLLLIAIFTALPKIMSAFSGFLPENEKPDGERKITDIVVYTPPPPKPIIPNTPPPPQRSTVAFVPPIVEEDHKVSEEPPRLDNDALLVNDADIGKTTIQGTGDGPPTLDDPGLNTLIGTMDAPPVDDDPVDIFGVQKPPLFPGGEAELFRYLAKNIQYPEIARANNISGVVPIMFIIGKDGSVVDVQVLRDIGGGCGKEAVRVVKSMPKWSPGESNGQAVKVRYTLPVRFELN